MRFSGTLLALLMAGGASASATDTISGRVWYDYDSDGTRDTVDYGLGDGVTFVRVELWDCRTGDCASGDEVLKASAITDIGGAYAFSGLPDGSYQVRIDTTSLTGSWTQTSDPDAYIDHQSSLISLPDGWPSGSIDFGYNQASPTSLIGDTVYRDRNGDGIQNTGDAGLQGVTVLLYQDNGDGAFNPSTDPRRGRDVTDPSGNYLFTQVFYCQTESCEGDGSFALALGIPGGNWFVQVDTADPDLPTGAVLTADPDEPGVPCTGCDAVGSVSTDGVNHELHLDFGFYDTFEVFGSLWSDLDADGVRDPDDPGLGDGATFVEVELWGCLDADWSGCEDGELELVSGVVTDPAGEYAFPGLQTDWAYQVRVNRSSLEGTWTQTADPDGTLDDRSEVFHEPLLQPLDFGYAPTCGDGVLDEWSEECDDGNLLSGDCCSATCRIEADGTTCEDWNDCTSDDQCHAGRCSGTPPGICPAVLTTSGPCDVDGDTVIDADDAFATPLQAEDEGNVCQELTALGDFAVTLVSPAEFSQLPLDELEAYDCIVLDTKPSNVTQLGSTWLQYVGVTTGGPVFLSNHDALWHSYFNRVLAPPDLPDDRFGAEILIRDAVTWACSGQGLAVFNVGPDNVAGAGFEALDSFPEQWAISSDAVDFGSNALGTEILPAFREHPVYAALTDARNPACDESGSVVASAVPNSIAAFPSWSYFTCPPGGSEESYPQVFRGFDSSIFTPADVARSSTNGTDPFPDVFPSDEAGIDGLSLSLVRERGPTVRTSATRADPNPVAVATTVALSATVESTCCNVVTVEYSVDDGLTWQEAEIVGEPARLASAAATLLGFPAPGVVSACMRGTDEEGNTSDQDCVLLPVYDPAAGVVMGHGWIDSPSGAYTPDPLVTGKARFGFVSRYQKGAALPTGHTALRFKAADLDFRSDSYDWLVVSGAIARFKGVGTVRDLGTYKFMVAALDAGLNASDAFAIDRFRIKIWAEDDLGNEDVLYDNTLGSGDDLSLTEIEGGSITIKTK